MRPLLGTFVAIRAVGETARLADAVAAAFSVIERVQGLMSFHDRRSDVARINEARPKEELSVDPETYAVLAAARAVSDASGGAFDITSAPALVRSGFLPRSPAVTRGAEDRATYRDLELLPPAGVRWRRSGRIDLGGIAKGYAVDRAIDVLRAQEVAGAIVNAGGDLRCFGEPQQIGVRDPENPQRLFVMGWLTDGAVATSGGYFASRELADGSRVDPLVDPHRRTCVRWGRSVSVAAPTCTTADALTKVVRLAPRLAPAVLRRYEAQALVVSGGTVATCGGQWFEPRPACQASRS